MRDGSHDYYTFGVNDKIVLLSGEPFVDMVWQCMGTFVPKDGGKLIVVLDHL